MKNLLKNIFKDKKFKHGINAAILTISIIGIIILINILLSRYSFRKDITADKRFELSEQTKSVLNNLDKSGKTVDVTLFTSLNYDQYLDLKHKDTIERLLNQYERVTGKFRLKLVDMDRNPAVAEKYGAELPYEVAFDIEGRSKLVSLRDMFEGTDLNAEQAFTSAMIYIMNETPSVVYFIQGHKEMSIDKELTYIQKYIQREGYLIKTLNIGAQGAIPEDASLLIGIGASIDYAQKEIEILRNYLDNGGRAMFMMSSFYSEPEISAINNMFKTYGIEVNNDTIIDPTKNKNFAGIEDMILPEYQSHEIVDQLKNQNEYYMVVPSSRSINIIDGTTSKAESLIKSSADSWGETSIEQYNNQTPAFDSGDKKGPLNVAVYVTKPGVLEKEMRLVVLGNSLLLTNEFFNSIPAVANVDFVLNSMAVLSDNKQFVTIRPKPMEEKTLILPANKQRFWLITLVIVLPLLILTTGMIIWLKRRHL